MGAAALTLSGALPAQDENAKILVQVDRLVSPVVIDVRAENPTYTVDLASLFQLYDPPGPVATFFLTLPEQDKVREVEISDGARIKMMTFKTQSGFKYESLFDINPGTKKRISADDFVMQNQKWFDVQLYPQDAPHAVANFMAQARANDNYKDLVIHHNWEGRTLRSGFVRLNPDEDEKAPPLTYIPPLGTFGLQSPATPRKNVAGTLSAYRYSDQQGANRQWFFNTYDNSTLFEADNRSGFPQMAVFGALIASEDLKILEEIAQANLFPLDRYIPSLDWQSVPVTLPFNQLDYTKQLRSTLLKFDSITVSSGTVPEKIKYKSELHGDPPAPNLPDTIDVSLDKTTGILSVTVNDTDRRNLTITATSNNQSVSFQLRILSVDQWLIDLIAPDEDPEMFMPAPGHRYFLSFLGNVTAASPPYLETDFGKLYLEHYPWIYHPKHGYIWMVPAVYHFDFFDRGLDSWVYTQPNQFEYFFLYRLNRWVYYSEDTDGLYDPNLPDDRDFWLFDENEEIAGWYKGSALLDLQLDDGAEDDDEEA